MTKTLPQEISKSLFSFDKFKIVDIFSENRSLLRSDNRNEAWGTYLKNRIKQKRLKGFNATICCCQVFPYTIYRGYYSAEVPKSIRWLPYDNRRSKILKADRWIKARVHFKNKVLN